MITTHSRSALVRFSLVPAACLLACGPVCAASGPPGFEPLSNGIDLTGWRGRPHLDPAVERAGTPDEQAKQQAEWNADLAAHWKVENGVS